MKRVLMSALLGTAALVPATAMAQSPQCDKLVQFMEQNQGTKLSIDMNRAKTLQRDKNEAECTTVLAQAQPQNGQKPAQAGAQQPAQAGASEDADATPEAQEGQGADQAGKAANIVVQQPAPTISVDQAAPQVTVNQPQPNVTVRQPQPEILVRQPAPVVTIDIPQPEIIVRMPQPEVTVQQAQPTVQVQQPQPQVRVEQPEQPQVQVQEAAPANVQLAQPEGQANVQVEQAGEAKVTYERAEPKVTINQAQGQPTIRMENMNGQPGAGDQAGQQPAADQAGQQPAGQQGAQLRDSEDPNKTPEAQEGQAQGDQQQAAATQAGQQQGAQQPIAGGAMQRFAVADLDGARVVNERGDQLGKVDGIVQSTADQKRYVVINHGGFLGLGEKKVALSLEGLMMRGKDVVVPGLTDDEIRALPTFEESDQYPEVEDTEVEFRTMAQQ
jgi:hypothetical protein